MDIEARDSVIERAPGSFARRTELDVTAPGGPVAAVPSNASSLLVAITKAASDRSIDMDKMERLFNMHQTIVKMEAQAAFNGALAMAQSKMLPIVHNRTNHHTGSNYADLAAINEAIVPVYTAEGLAVTFDTETKNDTDPIPAGHIRVVGYLTHKGGHEKRYHLDVALDDVGSAGKTNKTKVQAGGSTNSYGRRYLERMMFNLATMDDNDGNGTGKKKETKKEDGAGRGERTPPAYPEASFNANLPAWTDMIETGTKTAEAVIKTVSCKATLSDDQKATIRAIKAAAQSFTFEQVQGQLRAAKDRAALDAAADLITQVPGADHQKKLKALYDTRINAITK